MDSVPTFLRQWSSMLSASHNGGSRGLEGSDSVAKASQIARVAQNLDWSSDDGVFCLFRLLLMVTWTGDMLSETDAAVPKALAELLGAEMVATNVPHRRLRGWVNHWASWATRRTLSIGRAWTSALAENENLSCSSAAAHFTAPQTAQAAQAHSGAHPRASEVGEMGASKPLAGSSALRLVPSSVRLKVRQCSPATTIGVQGTCEPMSVSGMVPAAPVALAPPSPLAYAAAYAPAG